MVLETVAAETASAALNAVVAKLLALASAKTDVDGIKRDLAGVTNDLLRAQALALTLQQRADELGKENARLEDALKIKGNSFKLCDAYWIGERRKEPEPDGPFCIRCVEVDNRFHHLVRGIQGEAPRCPACKHQYDRDRVEWSYAFRQRS